jgi:hypothetical protein
MVGNIGLKHLKVIKEDTLNKWNNLGFLDGLKGHVKENIAQLYENQATNLINESSSAGDSGSFETVVFPIIRRVFSKLLANDIVSVQAMNLPIGKLFYFVPKIAAQTSGGGNGLGHPGNGTNQPTDATGNLYDAFYETTGNDDDGQFDYSRGSGSTHTKSLGHVTWQSGVLTDVVNAANGDLGIYAASACQRTALFALTGFTASGAGSLTDGEGNEMDSETFLSSLDVKTGTILNCCNADAGDSGTQAYASGAKVPFRLVTQKYGFGIVDRDDTCDSTGTVYLEADISCTACIKCASPDGYAGSSAATASYAATATYKTYSTLEFEDNMGEVSFELKGVTVSVSERKLRASWSPELAQDVSAFHNIDAEAELTALLSEEVAAEIDREILRDLRKGAAWDLRWDYNGWRRFSAGQAPYTQKDWNQTLITAINQLSAQIHKSTLRGGANWIVCSSEVSAIFDDLEYFHVSNAAAEQDQYNMGIEKVGTLSGRFTVYRDPYFPANQVLIGHKGTSLLDTGYVYAPYVPLQLTPTMYNPFNFTPIKGIMTRYAKKMVNNRFYGRITVDGVRTFDVRELKRVTP